MLAYCYVDLKLIFDGENSDLATLYQQKTCPDNLYVSPIIILWLWLVAIQSICKCDFILNQTVEISVFLRLILGLEPFVV